MPLTATLQRVVAADAHEGPVYVPGEHALYFTTVPRGHRSPDGPQVAIKRLALDDDRVDVVVDDANAANGMTLARDGHLVVCEQGTRARPARIRRLDLRTGAFETLVEDVDGLPLNSPNDVVVKRDGTIWFTDPSYGWLQGFRPAPHIADRVYRYDPAARRLSVAAESLDKPNGLAFSPDERVLYVGDSGANHEPGSYDPRRPHHIKAFDVEPDGRLVDERVFAEVTPGFPDGIKVDATGRVYASASSGVQVFSPHGDLVEEIGLPGAVNFTFGARARDVLFITADDAVWAAYLNVKGA